MENGKVGHSLLYNALSVVKRWIVTLQHAANVIPLFRLNQLTTRGNGDCNIDNSFAYNALPGDEKWILTLKQTSNVMPLSGT